jgi:enterochelin esterase-like enzyme
MALPIISRRQFLFGSLGVLALGGVGAFEIAQHPSALHRLGLENSPDKRFPDARVPVEAGTMPSKYMKTPVSWAYSMPAATPLATVFCLHGHGDTYRNPFDVLHLPDIAASLNLPLAFAAVQADQSSYWHKRADGTDAMSMLIEEFIPFIESRTKTAKRALYGWSMGGFGALLTAEMHPEMFHAVTALSPAVWPSFNDVVPGAFDDEADFGAHNVFARRSALENMPVRVACGDSDPFKAFDEQFVAGLQHAEVDFGKGFHDAPYWRSVSPAALHFIHERAA